MGRLHVEIFYGDAMHVILALYDELLIILLCSCLKKAGMKPNFSRLNAICWPR